MRKIHAVIFALSSFAVPSFADDEAKVVGTTSSVALVEIKGVAAQTMFNLIKFGSPGKGAGLPAVNDGEAVTGKNVACGKSKGEFTCRMLVSAGGSITPERIAHPNPGGTIRN